MSETVETTEFDAVAQSLVAIAQDAGSDAVSDAELVRRLDMIVDPYLETPDIEEVALKRVKLARALHEKCGGPGCVRVAAHILRAA